MIQSEYIALTSPKNVDDLDFIQVEMVISTVILFHIHCENSLFSMYN